MRILLYVFLTLFTAAALTGCGTKGKLKTPSQVEQIEQKKAKKAAEAEAKAKQEAEKKASEQQPAETQPETK